MALVMKNTDVKNFLETKMAVTDGVLSTFQVEGVVHVDVMTYPAQDNFADGAILGMIQKPFIDFAVSCGGAGAMTKEMILAKYPEFPVALAETIAADFAKAYGNYIVIPAGMALMITGAPVESVFDLMIPDPVEPSEVEA